MGFFSRHFSYIYLSSPLMLEYMIHTDPDLFARIAEGDERAFHTFFEKYKNKLYYFFLEMTGLQSAAEECVQDVFLRLWVSRRSLVGVDRPDGYLFIMARNRGLDFIKQAGRERALLKSLAEQTPWAERSTEETLQYRESRELLQKALTLLPQQQQKVYILSKLEGFSREEIALQLDISANTVKNHLSEAVKSVREFMEEQGGIVLTILVWSFWK